jgi:DNA-binding CsgD family transcriptional regulator
MTRAAPGAPLTARELEVAGLVAEGLKDSQIAARLCISVRTVHAHLGAAYAKSGTGSRVRLLNWLAEDDGAAPQGQQVAASGQQP